MAKLKNNFKEKVLNIVKKIKRGEIKTYKEVARLAGNEKAYRAVANILAENVRISSRDSSHKFAPYNIPCHRVIKNDHTIGGYLGSYRNSWKKLALLLKEGVIAVMPTDTIYGICGSALNKKVVEKIYKLRKRSPNKPMIILISDFEELKNFGVKLDKNKNKILKKIWPGPISVILDISNKDKIKKFTYLHRGTKTLAFRLPKPKWLRNILKISGPLVAPSANWEGYEPAKTINEAKKYFGNKVIYYDKGKIKSKPSTLIKLKNGVIEILRKGLGYNSILNLQKRKEN